MNNNVSVGPATSIGLLTACTAFVGSLVTYLTGDHTAQTVTALESGGAGLIILVVTLCGRYLQAHKLISSGIANDISKTAPDVIDYLEKILNVSGGEEPKTSAAALTVEQSAPVIAGDQSKLASQFQQTTTPPTTPVS